MPPALIPFRPIEAHVKEPKESDKSPHSLLGLPSEVRVKIWRKCLEHACKDGPWHTFSPKPYIDLFLVCRQIWHEIQAVFVMSIVPQNSLDRHIRIPQQIILSWHLRSLTIELPFNLDMKMLHGVSSNLLDLRRSLEVLKLSFAGQDAYGITSFPKPACAHSRHLTFQFNKLMIDGQGADMRMHIIHSIAYLSRLHTLVLANLNMPILQSHVLLKKRCLKRLRIEYDPSTSVHNPYNGWNSGSLMYEPLDDFPPVEELHLSANTILNPVRLAQKLSITLRSLTWTVPSKCRQAPGSINTFWWRDTSYLLQTLAQHALQLHTLRMCMESKMDESHIEYGGFMAAMSGSLPRMESLLNLEVHLETTSTFFPKEFLQYLPSNLERLYVSDKFIDAEELIRYVYETNIPAISRSCDDSCSNVLLCAPASTEPCSPETEYRHESRNHLKFVGFEHGINRHSEELKIELLHMNGRLLDGARNRHCLKEGYQEHQNIEDAQQEKNKARGTNEEDSSAHSRIDEIIQNEWSEDEYKEMGSSARRLLWEDCEEWFMADQKGATSNDYFRNSKAVYWFKREKVASPEDVEPRTYPVVVPVSEHDHWHCGADGSGCANIDHENDSLDGTDMSYDNDTHGSECEVLEYFETYPGRLEEIIEWRSSMNPHRRMSQKNPQNLCMVPTVLLPSRTKHTKTKSLPMTQQGDTTMPG